MKFSNYHTHTTYCDGKDTPEELVLEAIRLGCPEIGFSGHSHLTEHIGSMTEQGTLDYCAEIRRLQKKYADQITIRLGIEHGGDFYACAEDYYNVVATLYERTHCDVIAHFDLITKYNEGNNLYDMNDPRYVAAADAALDRLIECPVLLEVNTGAMARGYRTEPYPDRRILKRWLDAGKELIFAADCHDKHNLLYAFDSLSDIPHRETLC